MNDKYKDLLNKDINLFEKSIISKIVQLFEELNKKTLIKEILENLENEKDQIKKEIICIKLDSIINEINSKKFLKKTIFRSHAIYYYQTFINIYIYNFEETKEIFDSIEEFKNKDASIVRKIKNKTCYEKIIIKNIDSFKEKISINTYNISHINIKL